MNPSIITRALTVLGVAVGSALLVGALALAMRGISPVSSAAAVTPSTQKMLTAVQALQRAPHHVVRSLAVWHPPRIPKFHPKPAPAPRVVTVTAPPQVVQAPAAPVSTTVTSVQPRATTQAPPPAHVSEPGDDTQESGGGGND